MSGFNLIDALQIYLNKMTPAELTQFQRTLARNLPGFLEETYEKARKAAEPAYRPEHAVSSPAGASRRRRRS